MAADDVWIDVGGDRLGSILGAFVLSLIPSYYRGII